MKKHQTESKKFAARLIEAMLDIGQSSTRKSATGVTTSNLKVVAGVTNEMARRYTLGTAWPDNEKMAKIAKWLNVRQEWLRYGEGPKSAEAVQEAIGLYSVPAEPTIDKELLAEIIILLENIKTLHQLDITTRENAEIIADTYEYVLKKGLRSGDIMGAVEKRLELIKGRTA